MFTGIIPIAKDEDGLAVILGHGKSGVDLKEKKREFRADLFNFALLTYRNRSSSSTTLCRAVVVNEGEERIPDDHERY